MRVPPFVGALVAAGTVLSGALFAQNYPYVNAISVRNSAATEVEIHTSGTVASPNTQAITDPDRIMVDFPGALPSPELRALKVNRGPLKRIRAGLFFDNPPITRIVLDLTSAQAYQISLIPNGVVVRLTGAANMASTPDASRRSATPWTSTVAPKIGVDQLTPVSSISTPTPVSRGAVAAAPVAAAPAPAPPVVMLALPPEAPKAFLDVAFRDGMLQIHVEKATLADVLSEVQRQTQAEIEVPAGAEREQVVADLGPAPVREVLAALLNGSPYNFIFVGSEQGGSLEKVILSRRQPF